MSWIQTYSGHKLDLLNPNPDSIVIEDIAVALSRTPRYNGHCRDFYCVADHSVRVSYYVQEIFSELDAASRRNLETMGLNPVNLGLLGLMHDAPEAFIGDMVRPLKRKMPEFEKVDDNLFRVISWKFKLARSSMHPLVKQADNDALITEYNNLFDIRRNDWNISGTVRGWSPVMGMEEAEFAFLKRFQELNEQTKKNS